MKIVNISIASPVSPKCYEDNHISLFICIFYEK